MPNRETEPPKAVASGFAIRFVDHAVKTRNVVSIPNEKLNVDLAALERVPYVLGCEPAAAEISQNEKRRDELAPYSGAAEKKAGKRAQSANRCQQ